MARRWRPLTFDAVVGQAPIVRTLQNALARDRIAHAYLFAGPRGVGKTSTARLLAMGLGCERAGTAGPVPCATCEPCREVIIGRALDVIEVDGASNRGIDEVRALRDNARYAPARGRRKVYIIDEVHMLTEPAFNALLKTLEEPPAHIVFVLATTEPRRLPATIVSRCQRFDFRPVGLGEIRAGLERILEEERASLGGGVDRDALTLIARAADGSLRDALSLLETALAFGEGHVTAEGVRQLLGSGGAEAAWGLSEALVRRTAAEALARIESAAQEGHDLGLLCQDAMEVLRRALLARVAPGVAADLTAEDAARLELLHAGGPEELLLLVKGLLDAEAEMRRSPHPRVDLEVAAVRLCHRPRPEAIETLLERLEQAEAQLRGYAPAESSAPAQADLLGGAPDPMPYRAAPPLAPPERVPAPRRGDAAKAPAAPGGAAAAPPSPRAAAPPKPAPPSAHETTWQRIVAEITRVRPTLGRMLADAVVDSEDGDQITVSLPNGNAFTQDQVRNRSNRELLLETAGRVCPGIRDIVFATPTPTAGGGASVAAHPLVQAAVELFDGEVTTIRPAGSPRRRVELRDAWPETGEAT